MSRLSLNRLASTLQTKYDTFHLPCHNCSDVPKQPGNIYTQPAEYTKIITMSQCPEANKRLFFTSKKIRMSQCPQPQSSIFTLSESNHKQKTHKCPNVPGPIPDRTHLSCQTAFKSKTHKCPNVPAKQTVFIQQTNGIHIACPDRLNCLKAQINRSMFAPKDKNSCHKCPNPPINRLDIHLQNEENHIHVPNVPAVPHKQLSFPAKKSTQQIFLQYPECPCRSNQKSTHP